MRGRTRRRRRRGRRPGASPPRGRRRAPPRRRSRPRAMLRRTAPSFIAAKASRPIRFSVSGVHWQHTATKSLSASRSSSPSAPRTSLNPSTGRRRVSAFRADDPHAEPRRKAGPTSRPMPPGADHAHRLPRQAAPAAYSRARNRRSARSVAATRSPFAKCRMPASTYSAIGRLWARPRDDVTITPASQRSPRRRLDAPAGRWCTHSSFGARARMSSGNGKPMTTIRASARSASRPSFVPRPVESARR